MPRWDGATFVRRWSSCWRRSSSWSGVIAGIRLIAEAVVELQRQFYPDCDRLEPGTILWATTKAGDQAKVSWGKRAESYGIQMVRLPLVTKDEIATRMRPGSGRDPRDNRRKEFRRDTATLVRLVKSAAAQGGLLSGAELSVLMNRSLMKIHEYIRTYEQETGDPLPMKGYVLDQGSSPTHKGIICRKFEEGMSPPDIARATGHTLQAVDNYLGSYARIKVLLKKGFDAPTICQVTGRAARTLAEYLVIIERFHPELLGPGHRDWLVARRKRAHEALPLNQEDGASILVKLETGMTQNPNPKAIVVPGASGEADSRSTTLKGRNVAPHGHRRAARNHSPDKCPKSR